MLSAKSVGVGQLRAYRPHFQDHRETLRLRCANQKSGITEASSSRNTSERHLSSRSLRIWSVLTVKSAAQPLVLWKGTDPTAREVWKRRSATQTRKSGLKPCQFSQGLAERSGPPFAEEVSLALAKTLKAQDSGIRFAATVGLTDMGPPRLRSPRCSVLLAIRTPHPTECSEGAGSNALKAAGDYKHKQSVKCYPQDWTPQRPKTAQ